MRAGEEDEMIWALLAILGVPIWLVVGALAGSLLHRRRFAQRPGVFTCRVWTDAGRWGRTTRHALWIHDVLLMAGGLARVRIEALGIAGLVEGPHDCDARFRGSESSVAITVRTDDGAQVQVAAPRSAAGLLQGPFTEGA
jgi:hypothetical protein